MTKQLTCIVCPMGCELTVSLKDGIPVSVAGNTCKRGEKYAIAECVHPVRTVTTTVRTDKGGLAPVKTADGVPKDKIFDCMKAINGLVLETPARIGQVVARNIADTGVDLVLAAEVK